jgi:putative solute:sodium symporter small subunit
MSLKSGSDSSNAYWRATLGLLTKILIVWFVVSFGAGILFADVLNVIKLGGYPLGFWFAHQGSMYIFIALIFYYAKKMNDIDREFDVHED